MGSILIGIKRFFKNKNTVTIIAILAALGILYGAYYFRIKKATDPVSVPYATREIGPRTLITADMIGIKKVPGGIVKGGALINRDQIIGKYVSNKAVIPQDGLFYNDMVVNWEDMPSSEFQDIPDCYTVYALNVDSETTYGNSIFPGNYIDLYYKTSKVVNRQQVVWFGKFIESIKVLSVTDGTGSNVFETNGTPGQPSYLLFSVPNKVFRLLKIAERSSGVIIPVQRNANYSKNPKPTMIVNSSIEEEIRSYAVSDELLQLDKAETGRCSD
jgi:pilus assembly protein CpaB